MNEVDFYKTIVQLKTSIKEEISSNVSYLLNLIQKNSADIVDTQNAICDLSIEITNRLADIENALCELSLQEEE